MRAEPKHKILYQELAALLDKHAGHLTADEMLAIASNMVGKLVALQDHRKITPAQAMDLVAMNIELGNKQVIDQLRKSQGTS